MKGTQGLGKARTRAAITGLAATTLLLGACLSGSGSDSHWAGDIENEITISGSVGDGPAVNAAVRVRSSDGEELATFKSDSTGSYRIDIAVTSGQFPLLIDATGGTDIVTDAAPDFVLMGAAMSSRERVTANLNPFSTFAVELARDMNGGTTSDNLHVAEDIVVSSINSGLTTLAASGPMQSRIDTSNVAEMVKASETLAEIVRRTRDAMLAAGRGTNADAVIQALASDLIDGVIEGNGGPRADSRLAAVASIATAEVLLEAMANELHVNGIDATDAMRHAIDQVSPGTASPTLDELVTTTEMIDQALLGLSAAYAVTGDDEVYSLIEAMAGIQGGMEPALVRTLLPSGYRGKIAGAVNMAASGDQATIAMINAVVRDGTTPQDNANRAPTISGQPRTAVKAGATYDFTPTASDLDGDALTFSIDGKPSWATFDTGSGRLYGTPQANDVRRYDGITITVSDGELNASIGPFSIEVTMDNSAPTIGGTPDNTVGSGESYSFTPSASDPDGDTLQFEITGKPGWADFNTSTGRLSGTPEDRDVGLYQGIQITVTDGSLRASLAVFSIEVVAAGSSTGSVTLNWTPPTQNDDGSQLMNLRGYRIYWARSGSAYGAPVEINNPSVTRYIVDNLAPGTYEFAATAINADGVESRFSNAITRVVR